MKLEVGMYVRTKNGIAKIRSFNGNEKKEYDKFSLDNDIIEDDGLYHDIYNYEYYLSQIVKASHNIIDLVEENDVVVIRRNGDLYKYEVFSVPVFSDQKLYVYENVLGKTTMLFLEDMPKEYIVSIVTKEQFESMSYKL